MRLRIRPDSQRVSEEHGPDHRHMLPLRRERGDDAEGHHAEIEAHKSPEDVGLSGACTVKFMNFGRVAAGSSP